MEGLSFMWAEWISPSMPKMNAIFLFLLHYFILKYKTGRANNE